MKLYVEEEGSQEVRAAVAEADLVATSVVAYAESRAAFARRRREGGLTPGEHRRVRSAFDAEWPRFLTLDVTDPLARNAGELAERLRLRGFDAIHCASYLKLAEEFPDESVGFSSSERALTSAARRATRKRKPGSATPRA